MKVGDLVREKGLQERTGIIVEDTFTSRYDGGRARIYKVLWNKLSPASPTLTSGAWANQLEVINESR